jgi:glycosyltransferase involved in cell wall biosynthesis
MTEDKGIDYVLRAVKQYRERHGDVHFVFAGRGALEAVVSDFVARNRLDNVTQVPGFLSPAEVIRDFDVFVHPSVTDAMPMAVTEALMCSRPCIVSRVGGMPDLVRDGVEGFVIEPRDTGMIVDRMERFARMTSAELAQFGARARGRYEEACRPERVGATVAGHYRAILGNLRRDIGEAGNGGRE